MPLPHSMPSESQRTRVDRLARDRAEPLSRRTAALTAERRRQLRHTEARLGARRAAAALQTSGGGGGSSHTPKLGSELGELRQPCRRREEAECKRAATLGGRAASADADPPLGRADQTNTACGCVDHTVHRHFGRGGG